MFVVLSHKNGFTYLVCWVPIAYKIVTAYSIFAVQAIAQKVELMHKKNPIFFLHFGNFKNYISYISHFSRHYVRLANHHATSVRHHSLTSFGISLNRKDFPVSEFKGHPRRLTLRN